MELSRFVQIVSRHSGTPEETCREASEKTLEVFGELLTVSERRSVADQLPEPLAEALDRREPGQEFDIDEFYRRIEVKERAQKGFQVEHAQAVLLALTDILDEETLIRLRNHLSEGFTAHLEHREIPELEPRLRHDYEANQNKLSTGRPGSSRPINEARGDAHTNSVVSSDNPRAARKLSTGNPRPAEIEEETK